MQALQFEVADLATRIEAARLLVYQAADMKERGLPYSKQSAMAKLFAAETAMHVTTKCVQLHGGYGYGPTRISVSNIVHNKIVTPRLV